MTEPCWRCGKPAEINDGEDHLGPSVCCACYSPVEPTFEECPPNGLYCSVCGFAQIRTWSGDTCLNGHGGADGVPATPTASPDLPPEDFPIVSGEGWELLTGDCLAALKTFADESVDACVSDPPYGLSKEPDIAEVMRHWLAGDHYEHESHGFMNCGWDSFVPGPEYWREVYRVLKPGGHLLAFAGTRTMDLMSIAIRFAGFENRDTISTEGMLRWYHGQGFPKALSVSKALDEAGGPNDRRRVTVPTTEAARWDGYATSMKPAWEPILVFRKPLFGNVVENVLKYGTGALNIDACRVGTSEKLERKLGKTTTSPSGWTSSNRSEIAGKDGGRWPANLTLTHAEGCRVVGTATVKGDPREGGEGTRPGGFAAVGAAKGSDKPCGKLHGNAEVDVYECAPGCPVAELDRQSGERVSGSRAAGVRKGMGYHGAAGDGGPAIEGSAGGASRFFYTAKASGRERSSGLDDLYWRREKDVHVRVAREEWEALPPEQRAQGNIHSTIKPLALMQWLVRLVGGQPGSIILDPFAGSGTTLIAALLEGFKTVGIEQSPEYVEIARRRVEWWLVHSEGK